MAKASDIIKQAQAWLGKKESDGSHKEIINVYNSHKPLPRGYAVKTSDSWCATFVTAVAIKCNATDIIPKECGCEKMIELFKKINCWQENESVTPSTGWVIFYDWNDNGVGDNKGWSDHVGYVEKVENGVITTIEGNTNDAVIRKTLKVNAKNIRGYGVPKYDAEVVATPTPTPAPKPTTPVSSPSPTPSAPTTNNVIGTAVAKQSMKVRNGATTSNTATLGYISKGQTVEVLERLSNGWYKIVWKKASCGYAYTSNASNAYYTYTAKTVAPAPAPKPTPAPTPSPSPAPVQNKIKAGTKCTLSNTPIYSNASGATIGKRTGTWYAWEDEKDGQKRIRMTNRLDRVGVKGQVSFYVDVASLK